jgi:hypothetical protein
MHIAQAKRPVSYCILDITLQLSVTDCTVSDGEFTYPEAHSVIDAMSFGTTSELFGHERNDLAYAPILSRHRDHGPSSAWTRPTDPTTLETPHSREAGVMDWAQVLSQMLTAMTPMLPQILVVFGVILAVIAPLPHRGPSLLQKQDPWRRFKGAARREVMERAGQRCEGPVFLAWGRCPDPATEADHVYPWSKYGPTVPSNGQALCSGHNRRKGSMRPPWWYVLALEHRRRSYCSSSKDVRVLARVPNVELATHVTGSQPPKPREVRHDS